MKYGLFLGCTIPSRGRAYEVSARKVLTQLGVEYVDLLDFACCGFPLKAANSEASFLCSLRNLAVAEENGITNIIALCNGCTVQLAEANHEFKHSAKFREKAVQVLNKIGRKYNGTVEVKHFLRTLWEDIGTEKIKNTVKRPLEGLKVAPHYGCHYIKPSGIYGFDSIEQPHSLDELVSVTGATAVNYMNKLNCCGGALLGIDAKSTYGIAKTKLDAIKETDADCITLACPFCGTIFDDNQRAVEQEFSSEYKIPVIYYPQLLGLAFGISQKELGFNLNKVKPKELLIKMGITE